MTDQHNDLREQVRAQYAAAALQVTNAASSCCDPDAAYEDESPFGSGRYTEVERGELPADAVAASLGCGNPLTVADLRDGDTVLDLGSGGGIDVLLSARRVGPTGRVYGLDMTEEMLDLARANATKAGARNVEFLKGTIEAIPLPGDHVNVVISNCVINLSTDKPAVFAQTYRVLKPGGRIGITDVIAEDDLTVADRAARGEHTACIAGALTSSEYRDGLVDAGFTHIQITPTHQVADGMNSAIIRATKPAAPDGVTIRPMREADAEQVLAIYQAGLDTGNASFETTAPTWQAFNTTKLPRHRYVATDQTTGNVLGWIAASSVSDRCVYTGVIEHSLYIHPDAHGRGIGQALLNALIDSTETAGIWTIQSGIFPENTASLRLHEKTGFRTVGVRQRIGRHHDRWRDVNLMERRSRAIGCN